MLTISIARCRFLEFMDFKFVFVMHSHSLAPFCLLFQIWIVIGFHGLCSVLLFLSFSGFYSYFVSYWILFAIRNWLRSVYFLLVSKCNRDRCSYVFAFDYCTALHWFCSLFSGFAMIQRLNLHKLLQF